MRCCIVLEGRSTTLNNMANKSIEDLVGEFNKEFGFFTKDGTQMPISSDPDKELKEKFMMFFVKSLTTLQEKTREEERERIKGIVWDILSEYDIEVEDIRAEFEKALSNTETS